MPQRLIVLFIALLLMHSVAKGAETDPLPTLLATKVVSSIDQQEQPIRYWAPAIAKQHPRPLLILLHTWSSDYTQDRSEWQVEAVKRDWVYVQPNFRGRNDHPEACGSRLARQDILDALDWAKQEFRIDESRIYLAGVSGGGHMTMLMAGYHPDRFSAASAWVGISNLEDWYRFHAPNGKVGNYAKMIAACCGGAPGSSTTVDAQYRERSPIHHIGKGVNLPLDLNSGVKDGKTGSVPIHQTLRAYNVLAVAQQLPTVPEAIIDQLWRDGKLAHPLPEDIAPDVTYPCDILLRRTAGVTRVTIFDGSHQAHPAAAAAWLARQSRPTKSPERQPLPSAD
ncbi:MAG: prolyl oligopeptidase family serine peptidase [Planctomycetaceae bacterium]